MSTDPAVVAAAKAGDRLALEDVLRSTYDRIFPLCVRLLGDRGDAEDAAQDALLAIMRALPRFDGRAAFTTWTYRIATNACLDELRRRRRRPATTALDVDPATTSRIDADVADRAAIDAALAHLPPDFRAAVVLRDLCDLDYAEIGEVLDIPAGTVRSRIARGRAALAAELGGNQDDPGGRRTEVP